MPDGRRQSAGKESRVSHFHADEKMVSIEYGQAYGYADGSLLRRKITFEENGGLESGSFLLTDTFRSPEASYSLTENFVFPVAPEIKESKLLLTFDKEIYPFTVTVTLPEDAVLTVTPKVHVAHDGESRNCFYRACRADTDRSPAGTCFSHKNFHARIIFHKFAQSNIQTTFISYQSL